MAESSTALYRPRTDFMKRYVELCKTISMWPREGINPIRYWFVFFVVFFSGAFVEVAMCVQITLQRTNLDGIAQVIDFATVYLSALFRFLHVFVHGRRYKQLVEYMNENFVDESFNLRGEKMTMEKYAKTAKNFSRSFMILLLIWLMHMSVTPFIIYNIQKNRRGDNGTLLYPDLEIKMPLEVPMPFDTSQPHFTYLAFAIIITSLYSMSFIYCFLDGFWFVCVILATGQFELIAHSLRSFSIPSNDESQENGEGNAEERLEMERVLVSCVDHHVRIRRFINTIENLMHLCLLIDFLHAVASISFIMLDLSIAISHSTPDKLLNLFGYFIISVFHMWILDSFGNDLTVKEEDLSVAIYNIPWYKYPEKLKTQTLLMARVARNPCKLTGGKLYTVSLQFFGTTLRNIFSYFTVLLQLRDAT